MSHLADPDDLATYGSTMTPVQADGKPLIAAQPHHPFTRFALPDDALDAMRGQSVPLLVNGEHSSTVGRATVQRAAVDDDGRLVLTVTVEARPDAPAGYLDALRADTSWGIVPRATLADAQNGTCGSVRVGAFWPGPGRPAEPAARYAHTNDPLAPVIAARATEAREARAAREHAACTHEPAVGEVCAICGRGPRTAADALADLRADGAVARLRATADAAHHTARVAAGCGNATDGLTVAACRRRPEGCGCYADPDHAALMAEPAPLGEAAIRLDDTEGQAMAETRALLTRHGHTDNATAPTVDVVWAVLNDATPATRAWLLETWGDSARCFIQNHDAALAHWQAEARRARDDADEYDGILTRQGDLLTGTVNALKGDPPPLTTWSHHDLPELAAAVVTDRDRLRTEADQAYEDGYDQGHADAHADGAAEDRLCAATARSSRVAALLDGQAPHTLMSVRRVRAALDGPATRDEDATIRVDDRDPDEDAAHERARALLAPHMRRLDRQGRALRVAHSIGRDECRIVVPDHWPDTFDDARCLGMTVTRARVHNGRRLAEPVVTVKPGALP